MRKREMTFNRQKAAALGYFLAFLACIPIANWMIGTVGTECATPHGPCLVPIAPWGPGGHALMAPSGVLMIGLALVLRDMVQRRLGRGVGLAAIVAGAVRRRADRAEVADHPVGEGNAGDESQEIAESGRFLPREDHAFGRHSARSLAGLARLVNPSSRNPMAARAFQPLSPSEPP